MGDIPEALKQTGMTQDQYDLVSVFPGLVHMKPEQQRILNGEAHSLFHGERIRARNLFYHLRKVERQIEPMKYAEDEAHHTMLRAFHDFFVGDPRRTEQRRGCPYRGGPGDFYDNAETFRHAMFDVAGIYNHLIQSQPEEILVKGEWIRMRERMTKGIDLETDDPLELLRFTRCADERVRHQARSRLILGQACFEARRDGFKPEDLEAESKAMHTFLRRNFFADPEGEPVHVVAELDPTDRFMCRRHWIVPEGKAVPEPHEDLVVIPLHRQEIMLARGRPSLHLFFFIRHKQRMLLKMLDKHIRFTQLIGIGDPIAMMFVVEREDLEAVVGRVREVLVPSPGMVTDMSSRIGHRLGSEKLDPKNRRSSKLYEAMKYIARLWDRPLETQFLPMAAWINARCSRSPARHDIYRKQRELEVSLPTLFPEDLVKIPWGHAELQARCLQYAIGVDPHPELLVA